MTAQRDAKGRFTGRTAAAIDRGVEPVSTAASDAFLIELQASWAQHGAATIEKVRNDRPHDYLRLMASSLTKLGDGPADAIEAMSDDEIADELRCILERLDAQGAEARTRTGTEDQA